MPELNIYSEADLEGSAYARVLLTSIPKSGKTTSVLCTSPAPIFVLNADGPGAPMAARRKGANGLKILDVHTPELWTHGVSAACKMAAQGEVKTIVVDTITSLVNNVMASHFGQRFQGYDIWRAVIDSTMGGLNKLLLAPAHLFILSHYGMDNGEIALNGQLKTVIPALVHDRVHLDFDPKRNPPRAFMIGPSASGLSGGRHSDENKIIPADVRLLLAELGISE